MLICQLTDLHVRPVGKSANRLVETNLFTERAFRAVSRLSPRPDVVVITGDLTECGLDAEYANVARLLRKWLPMPVFVIPGNHDQRAPFREGLRHLPGVTADPHYVQYAVEDHAVRLVMLDTLVPDAGARGASRRATGLPRPHAGRRAGQADHRGDAPPAVRLRHRSHGPHQSAHHARVHRRHCQAQAGRTDHLRSPSPADRGPGGACHRVDLALGRASGRDVAGSPRSGRLHLRAARVPSPSLDPDRRHCNAHGSMSRTSPAPIRLPVTPSSPESA